MRKKYIEAEGSGKEKEEEEEDGWWGRLVASKEAWDLALRNPYEDTFQGLVSAGPAGLGEPGQRSWPRLNAEEGLRGKGVEGREST
ncbi:hypothetical protein P7K49_024314 [Saguinus oedipus]|uniref:Uncharacterized protein n=1 Tax=Saguinus oedipus TaxID=9490 RepID=A0ABQ9UP65_SAGOE|nr:hypothetical protein P7K49_024314 [Saguinus oedipus]